jgi:hypothetical protein
VQCLFQRTEQRSQSYSQAATRPDDTIVKAHSHNTAVPDFTISVAHSQTAAVPDSTIAVAYSQAAAFLMAQLLWHKNRLRQ